MTSNYKNSLSVSSRGVDTWRTRSPSCPYTPPLGIFYLSRIELWEGYVIPDMKKIAEHYDRISKYYDVCGLLGLDRLLSILLRFNLYSGILCYFGSGDAALDIACGTGNMSFELAKRFQRVYGLDISKGMLKRSKRKVEYPVCGNAENLPFKDKSFDAVTCILAVGHFPNPEMAVSEMKRVLKEGGLLVVNLIERAPPLSIKDKMWWLIFKRIWKRLDPKWKQQSTEIDSKKLLMVLHDAKVYERRDLLDPFFRCHFNNTVFVYRKRLQNEPLNQRAQNAKTR